MANFTVWIDTPSQTNCLDFNDFLNNQDRANGFKAGEKAIALYVNSGLRQANLIAVALMNTILPDDTTVNLRSSVTDVSNAISRVFPFNLHLRQVGTYTTETEHLRPKTNNLYTLGTDELKYKDIFSIGANITTANITTANVNKILRTGTSATIGSSSGPFSNGYFTNLKLFGSLSGEGTNVNLENYYIPNAYINVLHLWSSINTPLVKTDRIDPTNYKTENVGDLDNIVLLDRLSPITVTPTGISTVGTATNNYDYGYFWNMRIQNELGDKASYIPRSYLYDAFITRAVVDDVQVKSLKSYSSSDTSINVNGHLVPVGSDKNLGATGKSFANAYISTIYANRIGDTEDNRDKYITNIYAKDVLTQSLRVRGNVDVRPYEGQSQTTNLLQCSVAIAQSTVNFTDGSKLKFNNVETIGNKFKPVYLNGGKLSSIDPYTSYSAAVCYSETEAYLAKSAVIYQYAGLRHLYIHISDEDGQTDNFLKSNTTYYFYLRRNKKPFDSTSEESVVTIRSINITPDMSINEHREVRIEVENTNSNKDTIVKFMIVTNSKIRISDIYMQIDYTWS